VVVVVVGKMKSAMSGLMWRLWFISCSLGILFCYSISLLQAPPTVVVAGLEPSFPGTMML
jgi:hypothetical protein